MKNAVLYVLAFLAIQIGASLLCTFGLKLLPGDIMISETMTLIATTIVAALVTLVLFWSLKWNEVSPNYIRIRPWMVLSWSCIASFGAIVPSMAFQEFVIPDLPNVAEDQLTMLFSSPWGYVSVGLLAPLAEEAVFRGAVLNSLLKWQKSKLDRPSTFLGNHWFPICISALFFSLIHANPAQMPHAFLTGLLLGWLYYRTGSILPGVAYHWTNNTVAYILAALYPDPDAGLTDVFGSDMRIGMAVVFSVMIFIPALYQLHLRMKRDIKIKKGPRSYQNCGPFLR